MKLPTFLSCTAISVLLSTMCTGMLDNLRPLRGVLHDQRGAFEEDLLLNLTGSTATIQDLQDALIEGYRIASEFTERERGEGQRLRSNMDTLEQSSRFLFSFRRAEPAAKKASSCMGRSMLEASKYIWNKFNLTAEDSLLLLSFLNSILDDQSCKELMPKDCKDETPFRCSEKAPYRSIDGTCNNLQHPKWGAAMTPFVRYLLPDYEDGVDAVRGANRSGIEALPSPRTVSQALHEQGQRQSLIHISQMVMQWGQFLDHDIVHTPEAAGEDGEGGTMPLMCCEDGELYGDAEEVPDCRPIDVSEDELFARHNRSCMRFVRSLIASRGCLLGPREQFNQITSYIDGSAVYGSTPEVANALRTYSGGHLKVTHINNANKNGQLLPEVKCPHSDGQCFKAGDERVNEQPGLASMHTLWLRVHEKMIQGFAVQNPHWDDETLYQEGRRVVSALIQQITYKEFLPIVFGNTKMKEFNLYPGRGSRYVDSYDPNVDASIANGFATAAFRFGHTLINDILKSSGKDYPLKGNFMNSSMLYAQQTRPSALLEGLVNTPTQAADSFLVHTLINKLFAGRDDPVGLDLMALNIQRGRDHGLPPYNAWREACELQPISDFSDLASVMSSSVAFVFQRVYRRVDDIDLFPAGLAEDALEGGLLGPTFTCILGQQFSDLRRGDRFWYERKNQPKPFSQEQLQSLRSQSLSSLLCQHSDLDYIQPMPFYTVDHPRNRPKLCSSYPALDTRLWKEKQDPATESLSTCQGVGVWKTLPGINEWCTLNCFHFPPFCPPSHCQCFTSAV